MRAGPKFRRVLIVGLGLLGGSLALALKRRKLAARVVALGRSRARLRGALRAGLVDEISQDWACAAGADLILLCGPFSAFEAQLKALARVAPAGCLVADVGSVKGRAVARWHRAAGPLRFVASHPMAGGEKTGWREARAELFEGAACILSPLPATDPRALARVAALWRALGARTALAGPAEHDRRAGRVSHLPHAAAFALAAAQARAGRRGDFGWAGKGWFDTSRVAASDPGLWADIFLHQGARLQPSLGALQRELLRLRSLLKRRDAAGLRAWLKRASDFRRATGPRPR